MLKTSKRAREGLSEKVALGQTFSLRCSLYRAWAWDASGTGSSHAGPSGDGDSPPDGARDPLGALQGGGAGPEMSGVPDGDHSLTIDPELWQ